MTPYEKAYQRASRLMKAGIYNNATRAFDKAREAIMKSPDLTRAEKKAARNEIARTYLESETSTKTGIKAAFQQATEFARPSGASTTSEKVDYLATTDEAGLSMKEKADYVDASDDAKAVMIVKAIKGSTTVLNFAQQLGDDSSKFYEAIHKSIDKLYENPGTEENLSDLIPDIY